MKNPEKQLDNVVNLWPKQVSRLNSEESRLSFYGKQRELEEINPKLLLKLGKEQENG